jgi:hypothetical protein
MMITSSFPSSIMALVVAGASRPTSVSTSAPPPILRDHFPTRVMLRDPICRSFDLAL